MKKLIIVLIVAVIAVSCKKEDPYPLNDLVGLWEHDFEGYSGTGKAEEYMLELFCGGNYGLAIKYFSDVDSTDGCYTSYYLARGVGTYSIKGNQLTLTGSIERFPPIDGCGRKQHFNQTFIIEKLEYRILILKWVPKEPANELTTINIPLVKGIAMECED